MKPHFLIISLLLTLGMLVLLTYYSHANPSRLVQIIDAEPLTNSIDSKDLYGESNVGNHIDSVNHQTVDTNRPRPLDGENNLRAARKIKVNLYFVSALLLVGI
jgi:hypothetical protein